jgi:hypothetical protein
MRVFFLIFSVLIFLVSSTSHSAPVAAPFRGWVAVEKDLQSRFGGSETPRLDLGSFLGVPYGSSDRGLLKLLGEYGSGSVFQGGSPSGLNFFLWIILFNQMSGEIVGGCQEADSASFLSPAAKRVILSACEADFSKDRESQEALLYDLWLLAVGFSVPFSEFEEWKKQWSSTELPSASPDRLQQMLILAWMNPYFLLQN